MKIEVKWPGECHTDEWQSRDWCGPCMMPFHLVLCSVSNAWAEIGCIMPLPVTSAGLEWRKFKMWFWLLNPLSGTGSPFAYLLKEVAKIGFKIPSYVFNLYWKQLLHSYPKIIWSTAFSSSASQWLKLIKQMDADCLMQSSTPLTATPGKWLRIHAHQKGVW